MHFFFCMVSEIKNDPLLLSELHSVKYCAARTAGTRPEEREDSYVNVLKTSTKSKNMKKH